MNLTEDQLQKIIDRPASYSALKVFAKSPAHYAYYRIEKPSPTPVMIFGNLVDCLLFTPQLFEKQFFILKEENRPDEIHGMTSKANKSWKFEQLGKANKLGQLVTRKSDVEKAKLIIESLHDDPAASELLNFKENEYQKEISWIKRGKKCMGIEDIYNKYFSADLKITADADPDSWPRRQAIQFKYFMQDGMYLDGEKQGHLDYSADMKPFYNIVAENEEPFAVAVYRASNEFIRKGIEEYTILIDKLLDCEKRREFGGYWERASFQPDESTIDGAHILDLPYWMK